MFVRALFRLMKETEDDLIRALNGKTRVLSLIVFPFYFFCRTFHKDEKEQSSHSTEENVLTVKDLSTLFVDS